MIRRCESVMFRNGMPAAHADDEIPWFTRATVIGGAAAIALAMGSALGSIAKAQDTTEQPQQGTAELSQQDSTATMTGDPAANQSADAAATEETAEVPVDGQIVQQEEGTLAASELIGLTASSPDGEPVGTVTDLLLTEENQVDGVVVGIGGFLGIGQKEVALKMSEVSISESAETGERNLVLNSTLEALEQAPEFVSIEDQRAAVLQEQLRREAENAATPAPGNAPAVPTAPPSTQ